MGNDKFNTFWIVIILFTVLYCQKYETIEVYDDGTTRLSCQISNGLKDGNCIKYYETGEKKYVSSYERDTLSGMSKYYHKNGQIHWSVDFNKGVKNGLIKYYDSLGNLYLESTFENNMLNGISTNYGSDGTVLQESIFVDNQRHGQSKSYHENGELKLLALFENNVMMDYSEYNDNGEKIDQAIKYNVTIEEKTINEMTLKFEVSNPMYDLIGGNLSEYHLIGDSVVYEFGEFRSETFDFYITLNSIFFEESILTGTIFYLKELESGDVTVINPNPFVYRGF
jgi:antitoxin component YwqK of YwqJK toxin-antitoxin module